MKYLYQIYRVCLYVLIIFGCNLSLQTPVIHSFKTFNRRVTCESCNLHGVCERIASVWLTILTLTWWVMHGSRTSRCTLLPYITGWESSFNHGAERSMAILCIFHRRCRFSCIWSQWLFLITATTICWGWFPKHSLFGWQFHNEI